MRIINTVNVEIDGNFYTKEDILNLYRLQKQLFIEEGIIVTLEECINIWSGYSSDLAASWLLFPNNDGHIISSIKTNDYFKSFNDYL